MAINLWNWAVTKKVGSVISEEQKAKCMYYTFCDSYYYVL